MNREISARDSVGALLPIMGVVFIAFLIIGMAMPVLPGFSLRRDAASAVTVRREICGSVRTRGESMKQDRISASSALLFLLSLPSAHALTASASEVNAEDQQRIAITQSGAEPSMRGAARNFTGSVRLDPLSRPGGRNA